MLLSKIQGHRDLWSVVVTPFTGEPLYYDIQDDGMDIFGCGAFIGGGTW